MFESNLIRIQCNLKKNFNLEVIGGWVLMELNIFFPLKIICVFKCTKKLPGAGVKCCGYHGKVKQLFSFLYIRGFLYV